MAPTTSYTFANGLFAQDVYTWSYTAASSGSGFSADKSFVNLTFAGMVSVNHSFKVAGQTYPVTGTSEPATLNETVSASSLPGVIPE